MTLSLSARADHWGDRTAVVDISAARRGSPKRYSYADLASLARRFEAALTDRGIGAGDTVAVLSRNRVRSLALIFACLRLEATVAPVSHRLTPATVAAPVADLEPAVVVAEDAQGDLLAALEGATTATFDDLGGDREPPADRDPDPGARLVSLAADGSDGSGGIVEFSANAVEATCRSVATTWGLGRRDRVALTLALSAPDGLLGVALPTLYAGGTLLLDRAFDPADLAAVATRERVTLIAGRTAELRGLAEEGLADLDCEVVSDARVPTELRATYREHGIPIRRAYGAPVCPTILSSVATAGGDEGNNGNDDDLGWPLLDCRVRLVAEGGTVEGAGEGHLEVAGPMVGGWQGGDDGDGDGGGKDDWTPTGDRFRRDAEGRYSRIDRN